MAQAEKANFLKNLSVALRAARGTSTQAEFAKKFGISQTKYSRYEAGKMMPLANILCLILTQTRITMSQLLPHSALNGEPIPAPSKPHPPEISARESPPGGKDFPKVDDAITFISGHLGLDKGRVLRAIIEAAEDAAKKNKEEAS